MRVFESTCIVVDGDMKVGHVVLQLILKGKINYFARQSILWLVFLCVLCP